MTRFVAYHSKWHTSPLSHKCSHHMQSPLTFAPFPPFLTWCAHSPICFTQYVVLAALSKHPFPHLTYFIYNVQRFCKRFTISILSAVVWSCDRSFDGFRSRFVDVFLKWKWYYDLTSRDIWLYYFCSVFCVSKVMSLWVILVLHCQMDMLLVVLWSLWRLLGTRVRSHHGGVSQ